MMVKGRFFGSIIVVIAALAGGALWSGGCGTANNQGISFRSLGFNQDTGTCASLNDNVAPDPTSTKGFLDLENNLVQGINLDRADLSYRISGASLAIPNDAFPLAGRLGPSSGQEPNNPSTGSFQIQVVGGNTFEFLREHRNQLPRLPFTLVARVTAVGTSDAGDLFRTNTVGYPVIITSDGTCGLGGQP